MSETVTTTVRVSRTITRTIDQHVDVIVHCDPRGYPDACTRAKRLVEAQVNAGQSIHWTEASSEDEPSRHGAHSFDANLLEPPPIQPAPELIEEAP
jgi:hypothetical protein